MGEAYRQRRGVDVGLVEKPEGKRTFGRPCSRWGHNSKMALQEARCEGMDEIDVAQDRGKWQALVSVAMKVWVS